MEKIKLGILKVQMLIIFWLRRIFIGNYKLLIKCEETMPLLNNIFQNLSEEYFLNKSIQKKNFRKTNRPKSDKVVYTVLTGDYDNLISQYYYNPEWDYICFTDNAEYIKNGHPFWKIIPLDIQYENTAIKSRIPKILAHKFLKDYKYSLYIDANIDILSPKIFKLINELIKSGEICAITKHARRTCIYEEMLTCMQFRKESYENIFRLYSLYKKENFPKYYGLTENNVIFREHNNKDVIKVMEDWAYMVENYSKRDQLSLMYVCWKNNFRISPLFDKPLKTHIRDIFIIFDHKADKK